MQRMLMGIMSVLLILFLGTSFTEAAKDIAGERKIGVIIMGDFAYTMPNYCKTAKNNLKENGSGNISFITGDEPQSLFISYWARNGELQPKLPSEEEMKSIVAESGYDKILYLVVGQPVESYEVVSPKNLWQAILVGSPGITSLSVGMEAVLCDRNGILKRTVVGKESSVYDDYQTEDVSWLRLNSFRRCIKQIGQEFAGGF